MFLLQQGMIVLGQNAPAPLCEQYLVYLDLLVRWNNTYNLTGIKDPEQMILRHLLDSLCVRPYIDAQPCLDVGTGAGMPGLVLALSLPDTHWVLLDSNRKKVRFLNQAILELGIGNAEVIHERVEDFTVDQPFPIITSRALGSLTRFREITTHLSNGATRLLAMKGTLPQDEIAKLGENIDIKAQKLSVPGLDEERHLVIMQSMKEP